MLFDESEPILFIVGGLTVERVLFCEPLFVAVGFLGLVNYI